MDDLRRKLATQMKALSPVEGAARSSLAVENLADWLSKNAAPDALVGLYRSPDSNAWGEANPFSLIDHPALIELHFAFPRVIDRVNGEMDFAIPIVSSDWAKGIYGNPEPFTDLPAINPHDLDVIIVPGVVFGEAGERIGRGAGFYDRFLMTAPTAVRVGFAFDFQVMAEKVAQQDWDARMDFVITDLRAIETRARPSTSA